MKRFGITCAAIVLLGGCDTSPTLPDASPKAVIQAFLYTDEPVADVRITSTVPLGSPDTVGAAINDARVVVVKQGVRYTLTPSPGDSGFYHYPGADLTVKPGDVFDLEVTYGGAVATARTTVPAPPETLVLSEDSLVIPTFGGGFAPGSFGTQILARWPNPERELFFVTVEALEESPTPINIGIGRGGAFRRFIFPPIAADSFAISPLSLAHYGLHQVRVYRVNTEYAALYESRQQDTRDLNEPATNIRNGLGVFSAFGSRTVFFRAVAAQ